MEKIQRRTIEESDEDSGAEESEAVKAYSKYMIEIMKALILYKDPKADLQNIDFSALTKISVDISKAIYKVVSQGINYFFVFILAFLFF